MEFLSAAGSVMTRFSLMEHVQRKLAICPNVQQIHSDTNQDVSDEAQHHHGYNFQRTPAEFLLNRLNTLSENVRRRKGTLEELYSFVLTGFSVQSLLENFYQEME